MIVQKRDQVQKVSITKIQSSFSVDTQGMHVNISRTFANTRSLKIIGILNFFQKYL